MQLTAEMGKFVCGLSMESLPSEVIEKARVCLLNGYGIGLAISRQIVERHGGRLQVDSKPGEGAVFQLFLPLVKK